MKKKNFEKKLSLGKEVIASLEEQRMLKGGTDLTCECGTKEKDSCSLFMICCNPPKKVNG